MKFLAGVAVGILATLNVGYILHLEERISQLERPVIDLPLPMYCDPIPCDELPIKPKVPMCGDEPCHVFK